jgi:thiosulfate/3-mercaptopyruvate sulfurtransferase
MNPGILISPVELGAAIDGGESLVIIDTRDEGAYASGHIPGAVNLRDIFTYLATSTPEGVEAMHEKFVSEFGRIGLSGKETAVLYEDTMNSGFGQSCRGYFLLTYLGYPKIKVVHGGLGAWIKAGLPLSTEAATPTPATFPANVTPGDVIIDKDEMLAALDDSSIVKLDVRDIDEWIGESSSPYGKDFCPRKGRLPNAKWIEWYRMMKPTAAGPMFKSPEEVRAECRSAGIAPDAKIYLYCFKGARASNTYLALKEAGFDDVKMYFGSWNEWSRDPSLPIEEGATKLAA